jgi:N-acetyl-anhydromuramyl-L-alanine amidase AmpD
MTTIIPRTGAGLSAVVRGFNRISKRPLLAKEIPLIVCHYTGVKKRYASLDTAAQIRSIDRWKPNEYNYVIDQAGVVWEFSGEYQAAHCAGYNDRSYGVLFLNGTEEPLTDAQLAAFKFLTGALMWTNRVFERAWVVGHRQIAATACPGPVYDRIEELRAAAASHTS